MTFTYVTLTHTYKTPGNAAASGEIDFKPIVPMHNGSTVISAAVTATLSPTGGLSVLLAANTDPGTTPTGTVYTVTERLTGQDTLVYYIQIPHDQGSTLDLRDLAGWQGGTGGGGSGTVTSVNGIDPDGTGNITLSALDVGAQLADTDLAGLAGLGDGVPVRTSGVWGVATGTRDTTRFLRDDGTWQQPQQSAIDTINTRLDALDGVTNVGNAGTALAVTPGSNTGTVKLITLNSASCTMTFNNPAVASRAYSLELVLTQDATGGRTVTWPTSVRWAGGGAPTLSTTGGASDRLLFTTYNQGSTWYGDIIGKGYA